MLGRVNKHNMYGVTGFYETWLRVASTHRVMLGDMLIVSNNFIVTSWCIMLTK